jgi:hypothetical protein
MPSPLCPAKHALRGRVSWGNDHLWASYVSGRAWASLTDGAAGSGSESYAYGDGWRPQITLPAIQRDVAKPARRSLA